MENAIDQISLTSLLIAGIPVLVAFFVVYRFTDRTRFTIYAFLRMLIQLTAIGYALNFIFSSQSSVFVLVVLMAMLIMSSTIPIRTFVDKDFSLFFKVMTAIFLGVGANFVLLTQVIIDIVPWYNPRNMIPLAGMLLFNSLNAITLGIDRYERELSQEGDVTAAEHIAMKTAIIPISNSFLAAGIVSLPGLMTGQILSGISPLIAVRYQIVIMCMIFSSQVFSVGIILKLIRTHKRFTKKH